MEARIGGEKEQMPGVVSPPDLFLTLDDLHDGVETALRGVQVTRHGGAAHLILERGRGSKKKSKECSINHYLQ